jgi:hypothetical protein
MAALIPPGGSVQGWIEAYGLSPAYLEAIPFISAGADAGGPVVLEDHAEDDLAGGAGDRDRLLQARGLFLDPGFYRAAVSIRQRCPSGPETALQVELGDAAGRVLQSTNVLASVSGGGEIAFDLPLEVPGGCFALRIRVPGAAPGSYAWRRLEVRPDTAATLAEVARLRDFTMGVEGAEPPASIMSFDALMAMGAGAVLVEDWSATRAALSRAHELRPASAAPVEMLAALRGPMGEGRLEGLALAFERLAATAAAREVRPVDAVFGAGHALKGFRLRSATAAPGGTVGLNLYWEPAIGDRTASRLAAWVHFVGEDGRRVFQGDQRLADALRFSRADDGFDPVFREIPVPPGTPPGRYSIRVGLYDPESGRRLRRTDPGAVRSTSAVLSSALEVRE